MGACTRESSRGSTGETWGRLRILLVSPFDFGHAGGVNEHVVQLDREFTRLGHSSRILAATSPDVGETDDGHVYRLGASIPLRSNGSTARITLSPLIIGKVKRFLREEQFDIIHLHEPLAPALPWLVLMFSQSVNVGTFHAARTNNILYHYTKTILDMIFAKLDARIAVSEAAREFVDSYFPAEYEIVPNGISLEQYGGRVEPLPELCDGRPNILFVGRYDEPRKGFRYLLRAFPKVLSQFPEARLIVVGSGDPTRYERFMNQHGLSAEQVVFTGYVDDHLKARYYASCDVFCAPSTGRESFGFILLEAMASGKPVIASAISGYRDVVRAGQDGILVEPKDADALALAIVRVLADSDLRAQLTVDARRRADSFSWEEVARRVLEVYESALNADQSPHRDERSMAELVDMAGGVSRG